MLVPSVCASMCVASPITRGRAWECVECCMTSMVTFPKLLLPGQQLRPTHPREQEKEEVRRDDRSRVKTGLRIVKKGKSKTKRGENKT